MKLKIYSAITSSYKLEPWQFPAGTRIIPSYCTKPNKKKAKKIPLADKPVGEVMAVFRWYLNRYNKSDSSSAA